MASNGGPGGGFDKGTATTGTHQSMDGSTNPDAGQIELGSRGTIKVTGGEIAVRRLDQGETEQTDHPSLREKCVFCIAQNRNIDLRCIQTDNVLHVHACTASPCLSWENGEWKMVIGRCVKVTMVMQRASGEENGVTRRNGRE